MNIAPDSKLTIDRIDSLYEVISDAGESPRIRRRLDRIAREQLPAMLAEHVLPLIDPRYSVVRIRRIAVRFQVGRHALENGALPHLWARHILQEMILELRHGSGTNVARFVDHADFVGAFVAELLQGTAWQKWEFNEFGALRHLSVGAAVTELLCARPQFFGAVAAHVARRNGSEALVQTLGEPQAARILQALESTASPEISVGQLLSVVQSAGPSAGIPPALALPISLRRLLFLLHMLSSHPALEGEMAVLLRLSQHTAELHRLLAESQEWRSYAEDILLGYTEMRTPAAEDPIIMPTWNWIGPLQATQEGRTYLRGLLRIVRGWLPGGPDGSQETGQGQERPVRTDTSTGSRPVEFFSAFAGLGLLLTTIRDLKLSSRLPRHKLRRALAALMDEEHRELCELDPVMDVFFPLEGSVSSATDCPPVDADLLQSLPEACRAAVAAALPVEAWGILIASRFAERLRGLEASSATYLRHQFLQRPGTVRVDAECITVNLLPVPLAIVLRMAGMEGWQGRLRWAGNRELVIEITGG